MNTNNDQSPRAGDGKTLAPLEEALKHAYYYDETGEWRGPGVDEWDRWHAVAKAALAAAPAVSAPSPVHTAALNWWLARRPIRWTEEQHIQTPTVNCAGDWEKDLALAVASSLQAPATGRREQVMKKELILTPWFPHGTNPARDGVYEAVFCMTPGFAHYRAGKNWSHLCGSPKEASTALPCGNLKPRWRGLAENPSPGAAPE